MHEIGEVGSFRYIVGLGVVHELNQFEHDDVQSWGKIKRI
jgi:hypothetical protein